MSALATMDTVTRLFVIKHTRRVAKAQVFANTTSIWCRTRSSRATICMSCSCPPCIDNDELSQAGAVYAFSDGKPHVR